MRCGCVGLGCRECGRDSGLDNRKQITDSRNRRGDEICEGGVLGGGDLGSGGDYAAVLYFCFDWEAGSAGDYASGILLRICGVRAGLADCVSFYWEGSDKAAADDDSVGGGEVYVLHGGDCTGDAGEDEPEGSGVCGDGFDVGGVVCGGVGDDGKWRNEAQLKRGG